MKCVLVDRHCYRGPNGVPNGVVKHNKKKKKKNAPPKAARRSELPAVDSSSFAGDGFVLFTFGDERFGVARPFGDVKALEVVFVSSPSWSRDSTTRTQHCYANTRG